MTEPNPIVVKAIHYQFLAGLGLLLVCLGMRLQDVEIGAAFLALLGLWMILFPRPRMPLAFLVLTAVIQFSAHYDLFQTFQFTPAFMLFEPTTVVLAAGMMIFLGSQYRLLALKWHVTPHDPRFAIGKTRDKLGRPVAPQTRPEAAIGPDEIVRMIVNTAFCVLLGQWAWSWLSQDRSGMGFEPRFMQIAILIWFGIVGLFLGAGVAGYWRRAHSEPDLARLCLQEIDWREARREYGRIGRWIAWGKRKMRRTPKGSV
jgi:hypothetical protein